MAGGFHPKDIERVKSTDIWLQRFLEQEDLNPDASLEMLWKTCTWRKEFGTNGTIQKFYGTRNANFYCKQKLFTFGDW